VNQNSAHFTTIHRFLLFVIVLLCAFEGAVQAQGLNAPPRNQDEGFSVAPIPIIQPVTEEGAGLALVYGYHLGPQQKTSSSSSTSFGGFITGNRSWGGGVSQRFYWKDDKWRARMTGSYADVQYNYYGIGTETAERNGNAGISVFMDQRGWGALADLAYRFHGEWYAGGHYRFLTVKSSFRPNPQFDASTINPRDLDLNLGSLGPRLTRDTRSDTNYPREGSLLDLKIGFDDSALGGQVRYQTYDLSYSKYLNVASGQVLAIRGASCFAGGRNVPFWDLCLVSASENLRGYRASRYRDRSMLASQAEYRWEAWKRLGFVAFGGAGEVAPKIGDFTGGNVLPSGGAGVRFRVTQESHVNLRFDYAWGKNNSHEAYFYIGEAF